MFIYVLQLFNMQNSLPIAMNFHPEGLPEDSIKENHAIIC